MIVRCASETEIIVQQATAAYTLLLCSRPVKAFWNSAIRLSVCLSVNVNQQHLTWLEQQNYYEVHEGASEFTELRYDTRDA